MSHPSEPVVEVYGLTVEAYIRDTWTTVVHDVSFAIRPGEALGLVGESGSGKSTMAYALFGYTRAGTRIRAGSVRFAGQDLLRCSDRQLRDVRGSGLAMVPQNPGNSLTPSMRIGRQIAEVLRVHGVCRDRASARTRAVELLAEVGLPRPLELIDRYPHQLSGGQQQRVAIAVALAGDPRLLVLDEPTTALDVTSQARVLRLLARLRAERGVSMLYVTHDLGVLAQVCDPVSVMYAGRVVEQAPATALFHEPRHPYSRALIAAIPGREPAGAGPRLLRGTLRRSELPPGCPLAPRCPHAQAECAGQPQVLTAAGLRHEVACWKWETIHQTQETTHA
jgi:peptide/nickel transport system ATP-binding protein